MMAAGGRGRSVAPGIVDSLPGLVWTALPDGRIDFVNQRWCQHTGVSPTEARAGGWETGIHADDLAGALELAVDPGFWRSSRGRSATAAC